MSVTETSVLPGCDCWKPIREQGFEKQAAGQSLIKISHIKQTAAARTDCIVLRVLNQIQILVQLGQNRISKVVNNFYA